jgi:hypothetical protein
MKKLIRNAKLLILGLILSALPAMAGYFVKDIGISGYNSSDWYGDTVWVPSGAIVSYHATTYDGAGSYASVYATAPGVFVDLHVYDNQTDGGYQITNAAGAVDLYIQAYTYGGGANCGVTLVW